jgi:3-deoxy-D-manno-octulosonic-acid transferase
MEIIHNPEELSQTVCQLFLDSDRHEKMTKAARKVVDKNKGALEKLLKLINPLLKS